MQTERLYDYLHDALSRGNLDEIFSLYKDSIQMGSVGEVMRIVIDKEANQIARLNGYTEKFQSFKDLVEYYDDANSPLRRLCINNGFILISRSQKFPYTKEEFFRLFKKTTLRGARVIFEIDVDDYGDSYPLKNKPEDDDVKSFCFVREGDDLNFTFFDAEFDYSLEYSDSMVDTLTLSLARELNRSEIYTFDNLPNENDLNYYFDDSIEVTNQLESNNHYIFVGNNYKWDELVMKTLDNNKHGFINFKGVDETGEYISQKTENGDTQVFYYSCVVKSFFAGAILENSIWKEPYRQGDLNFDQFYSDDLDGYNSEDTKEEKLSFICLLIVFQSKHGNGTFDTHYGDSLILRDGTALSVGLSKILEFDLDQIHCCVDTGNKHLSLYTLGKLDSKLLTTKDGRKYTADRMEQIGQFYRYRVRKE